MKGHRRDPERAVIRTLLRRAPLKGARVVDIGCGDGRLTRQIARVARAVVAVDPDPVILAQARSLTPRKLRNKVRYLRGTAERPGTTHRFDVALFSGSL